MATNSLTATKKKIIITLVIVISSQNSVSVFVYRSPNKMNIYRNRKYLASIISVVFAFVLGCSITLSFTNVEKNCNLYCEQKQLTTSDSFVSTPIFLIIIILSAPKNIAQREVIRATWLNLKPKTIQTYDDSSFGIGYDDNGFLQQDSIHQQSKALSRFMQKITKTSYRPLEKPLNLKVAHYFVVGTETLSTQDALKLSKEQEKNKDLLLLNNLSDSYANLTQKLLLTIEAVNNIKTYKYVLKVDDDTYVKLDYLLEDLYEFDRNVEKKQYSLDKLRPELYWGYFNGKANVQRRGQWKEANFNLCERYLPYALGGGYVLSKNLVDFVATNSHWLSRYISEDISMGIWLSSLRHVYRRHDIRFDTAYLPRQCKNYHIVLHKRTVSDMRDLYRGFLCTFKQANDTTVRRPNEYFYDWNRSSLHCCDTLVNDNPQ